MDIRVLLCENEESRQYVTSIFDELKKEFKSNSDRGITVVAASIIDALMEDLLESFLVPFESKADRKNIFSSNGPLSNISNKIEMAFSLGLLSVFDKKLLKTLVSIRNKFAHQIGDISFKNDVIIQKCKQLIIPDELLVPMDIDHKIDNRVVINKPRKGDHREWFQTATYIAITILASRKLQAIGEARDIPKDFEHRVEFSKISINIENYLIKVLEENILRKEDYNLTDQELEQHSYLLSRLKLSSKFHEEQKNDSLNAIIIENE